MKYVIWGAGRRGKRIFPHIKENVIAFIDNDREKIGKNFCGCSIVSIDQYDIFYSEAIIIIATINEEEIIEILKKRGDYTYLLLSDCPGDLKSPNPTDALKKYIKSILNKELTYGIVGLTLYSILVYEWIIEFGGRQPYILFRDDDRVCVKKKLISDGYKLVSISSDILDNIDKIYICDDNACTGMCFFKKIDMEKIFDCSKCIDEYYNPIIEKYKNLHQKERCFIVATGPSLNVEDLNKLYEEKEICISMNYIWRAFDKTKWRPNYYLGADSVLFEGESRAAIEKESKMISFMGDSDEEFWKERHNENIIKCHIHWTTENQGYPSFSEDFARVGYTSGTVTYICLQLAAYMGFSEIYLLGVDFSYANDDSHSKYGHFYNEKNYSSIGYEKPVRVGYLTARKYADEHGIKIYNATRGGKLEIFHRVDFDSLFE